MLEFSENSNSSELMQAYQNRIMEIFEKLSVLQGEKITSFEVKKLVGEYEFTCKQLFQMKDVKELLLEVAREYMENIDTIEVNDEKLGTGASKFIGKAINAYFQN